MDRKTELEIKKAKLDELRKQKAQRTNLTKTPSGNQLATPDNSQSSTLNDFDADKILIECGITAPTLTTTNSSFGTISPQNSSSKLSFPKNRKAVKLTTNQVNFTEIPPRELVKYTKETQTPTTEITNEAKPVDYYVLTYDNINDDDEVTSTSNGIDSLSNNIKSNKLNNIANDLINKNEEKILIKEISDDERIQLIQSDDFMKFFNKNSRILERALEQDDIFLDYGGVDSNKEIMETGEKLKFNREFHDDNLKNRIVTWLDWSPQYPELLLASYEDSAFDPDGVAIVWNSKFKSTVPEYTFNCSSWVTSCCFAKFHPNLIIGGTYSGQIVMWDNRSNKRTPIQRSSLSAASHTHPVYCIQVVGSQNANNLISISNDGKLCSWTLDNMNSPQETLDLQCKQSKNVAVTTMGFRNTDVNNFIVGSEEGPIYTATRHGNKSGINECFDGHFGPVTGLSINQAQGPIDFSNIFLTSSFDWSIKLWNLKEPGKALYSFENNSDYVYEASWSPVHPALFASIDGTGRLDLWNLINDSEVPISTVAMDAALNKIRWTPNGLQIAVGDDQGKISIFDVNENYAQPRADDWGKFVKVLQDLKQNSSELDDQSINQAPNIVGGQTQTSSTDITQIRQANSTPQNNSPSNSNISILNQIKTTPLIPK